MIDVEKLAREAGLSNQFPTTEMLGLFGGFAALVLEQAAQKCNEREREAVREYSGKALRPEDRAFLVGDAKAAQDLAEAIRAMKPEAK